jgi:hypothetical protein
MKVKAEGKTPERKKQGKEDKERREVGLLFSFLQIFLYY